MKYVMMQVEAGVGMMRNFPILFADDLTHAFVARAMKEAIARDTGQWAKPVSAGFIVFDYGHPGGIGAMGKSESLHLDSREEDAAIIRRGGGTERAK